MRTLHWFRNDLRCRDHEALHRASESSDVLIPVFCINPNWFQQTKYGFPKCGSFRAKFLFETLENLRDQLKKLDSDLIIRIGKPKDILPELCEKYAVDSVSWQQEITPEEMDEEQKVRNALADFDLEIYTFGGLTLFHPDDLPFPPENVPDVFTAFRKKVEKYSSVREEFEFDSLPPLPDDLESGEIPELGIFNLQEVEISQNSVLKFTGGSQAALDRLQHYFWETDQLKVYKETRNGLLGADYSSKFSSWLANGALSPRTIYHEIRNYEEARGKNDSTYWLIFELLWRDYFKFIAQKYGASLFYSGGFKKLDVSWSVDSKLVENWQNGTTGIPFIDANMRELNQSGFMSNRGRQNVASFFSKYLNLDWRMGAAWFESQLIDYDVCSNWGNWAYVSGVGNDPRDRYFNILLQAERYDADGDYTRLWIPEIAHLPDELLQTPWKAETPPEDYPAPMINFEERLRELQQSSK